MAEMDDSWSANASEALALSLVVPGAGEPRTVATFNPQFTYSIFGEDERIFGYQNLKISLRFHVSDMRPHVQTTFTRKFKAVGDTEATDIEAKLRPFLPPVAFSKSEEYAAALNQVPHDWTPPGELNATLAAKDGVYEVWKANATDPAVRQLLKRIQILVLLFIEGGSFIEIGEKDSDMDRWDIFFLYHKRPLADDPSRSTYLFAGYSTVYNFFLFQAPKRGASHTIEGYDFENSTFSLSELPCRTRISQFVIIPPSQGKGLGGKLYNAIFQDYLHRSQTIEITVEDPNETFDDLRDLADLTFLRGHAEFNKLAINKAVQIPKDGPVPRDIVDVAASEALRQKHKIAPRQFSRVFEMNLMSKLPDTVRPGISANTTAKSKVPTADEHEYRLWKLLVKQRLCRHNKDALIQLEQDERVEKLAETLASVEFEYARLLALHERRSVMEQNNGANGKRKVTIDAGEEPASKRARVDDA